MPLITDSEMEDFESAIINAGFEVADFSLVQIEDPPTGKEQYAVSGTATVHRISTDEAITYSAGHLSTWVSEFEIDMHDGKFGEP
jgi:hypothetical protein